ncbi:hypothetical protein ASPFODRAFT_704161 [Aspergillus luchuensis CBS 106.47]|uniref:Uncharacterized protein n=1 Tax=Aspergillus luchuensis (strain CBS 106.47) TaxID=1137211 RepID=A0A1M3T2H5_ASPLC|nr:hypothetical protein ASPFODRAFT_704161 [Aspergillus luchuensis CBS 106.47]
MGTSIASLSDDRLLSISRTEPSSTTLSENEQQAIWKTCSVSQRKMFLGAIYFSEIDMTFKRFTGNVIADAAEKDIHGIATMAAHADTHAALSEREVPSIQNPTFSRFCHARRYSSYSAYRLGKMQQQVPSIPIPGLLSPLSSLTDCVGRTGRLTQPQSGREEAATGFIYSDVKPTVLPLETSTDDVPVNTDNLRPSMPRREFGLSRSLPFLTPLADYQTYISSWSGIDSIWGGLLAMTMAWGRV